MSSRYILPFADVGNGIQPEDGAKFFFFEPDGVTPKDTFSDQLSTPTPNTNPVIADSNGVFGDIFINGEYKNTLKDKNDVQIFGGVVIKEVIDSDFLDRLNPATLAAWQADIFAEVGDVVTTKERSTGNGGGGTGEVIASGTETGFRVVKHNTLPLSWALRTDNVLFASQWGVVSTNLVDSTNAILSMISEANAGDRLVGLNQDEKIQCDLAEFTITKSLHFRDFHFHRTVDLGGRRDFLKFVNVDGFSVKRCTFDSNGQATPVRNQAISAIGSSNGKIQFNKIIQETDGIFIYRNCTNIKVNKNRFNTGLFGVATGGDDTGNVAGQVAGIDISYNYFTNIQSEAVDINFDTKQFWINKNLIVDCGTNGGFNECIDVGGGTANEQAVISGNFIIITDDDTSGIRLKLNSENIAVKDNIIFSSTAAPSTSFTVGVRLELGVDAIDVSSNRITGFDYGVFTDANGDDVTIDKNTFKDQRLRFISHGLDNVKITKNTMISALTTMTAGINSTTNFECLVEKNKISIHDAAPAIAFTNSKEGSISKNNITGSSTAITLSSNSDDNDIHANKIKNTGDTQIKVTDCNSVSVNKNKIKDSNINAGSFSIDIQASRNIQTVGNILKDTGGGTTQGKISFNATCDNVIATENIFDGVLQPSVGIAGGVTGIVNTNNLP